MMTLLAVLQLHAPLLTALSLITATLAVVRMAMLQNVKRDIGAWPLAVAFSIVAGLFTAGASASRDFHADDVSTLEVYPDGGSFYSRPHPSKFQVTNSADGGVYLDVDYDGVKGNIVPACPFSVLSVDGGLLFREACDGNASWNDPSGTTVGVMNFTGYLTSAKGMSALATTSGAGASVVVGAASPPTADQILKATSATAATWQTLYLAGSTTNPGAVTAATCANTAVTITGAAVGDGCVLGAPATVGNLSETCFVSATNAVQIHICNVTAGDITPPVGTYNVKVFH